MKTSSATEIDELLSLPLSELVSMADKTRAKEVGSELDLCNIMNAKSGMCKEDCKFCAQSCRHSAKVEVYALKSTDEIVSKAKYAKAIGAGRFGIVTSGNTLTRSELRQIAEAIREIKETIDIKICASLGNLDEDSLSSLKDAGLSRYHHNIETSPDFYPKIVSTHSFEDRVKMIRSVKSLGIEICSGGIIGMGESWQDRIMMADILKELDVTSVPINVLVPIKGTPLGDMDPISCADAIRTIAVFRIILKNKTIKVAAGRETVLKDFQSMAFMAGANGMLIGGYLTIRGREIEEDKRLVEEILRTWKV